MVEFGAVFVVDGFGDDEWGFGFVDEDAVEFVHDGEVQAREDVGGVGAALEQAVDGGAGYGGFVGVDEVFEVVEGDFFVGDVGDGVAVLGAAVGHGHVLLNDADAELEKVE